MKRKADKPKPEGRDPVDVILDFESLKPERDEEGYTGSFRLPSELYREVLDLLKRTKREGRGSPPKTYLDRDEDSIVMGLALSRFEKLKGSREECLYKASRYAAAHDKRPEGKRLTAATIRDRLEHPGKYPPPPSRPCDFFRRG